MSDTARQPVIVAAARTPIGKFLGALSALSAPDLGAVAIREAVRRSGVDTDDVELGDQTMVDGMIKDGLWCATCEVHMGGHAEYTARKAGLTRQEQDEFA